MVSEMLEIASQLSEDEKYEQAAKYYENILQTESDNIGIINDYGVTLQNLEHYNRALVMYDIILNLEPKNMNVLINKGSVLHALGKYHEAISCYDIVLNIDKIIRLSLRTKDFVLERLEIFDWQ